MLLINNTDKYFICFFIIFIARLSKLNLFDDNSSFFSKSSFNSFLKLNDGSSDSHSHAMSNAQLPDLLNGTLNNNNSNSMGIDAKQLLKNLGGSFGSNEPHDDWESAFKYLMSKSSFGNNKHYEEQQQQEDWLRFQEMRKHSNMSGLNQFNNMFNSKSLEKKYIYRTIRILLSAKRCLLT